MVTITRISFPTESSKEMGKRFMDIPPLPTYITRKGPYIHGELGVGIQLITLWEYDPSKMGEANIFLGNYYAHFFGVPGYTYNIGTWYEVQEAFKMIGLG